MKCSSCSEEMVDAILQALTEQDTLDKVARNTVCIEIKDVTQCIQSLTVEFQT